MPIPPASRTECRRHDGGGDLGKQDRIRPVDRYLAKDRIRRTADRPTRGSRTARQSMDASPGRSRGVRTVRLAHHERESADLGERTPRGDVRSCGRLSRDGLGRTRVATATLTADFRPATREPLDTDFPEDLRRVIRGEVRFDRGSRALSAADGSNATDDSRRRRWGRVLSCLSPGCGHSGGDPASNRPSGRQQHRQSSPPDGPRPMFYGSSSNLKHDQGIAARDPAHHESRGGGSIRPAVGSDPARGLSERVSSRRTPGGGAVSTFLRRAGAIAAG